MNDYKREHISLVLPFSGNEFGVTQRKSLRRYWNQLSRFQRNLILIIIVGICVTLLLSIPTDSGQLENKGSIKEAAQINIVPIKDQNNDDKSKLLVELNNKKDVNIQNSHLKEPEQNLDHNLEEPKHDDDDDAMTDSENMNKVLERSDNNNNNNNIDNNNIGVVKNVNDNHLRDMKDFKGPTNDRQRAVVGAFKHAWKGYKAFAWGHDNLKPISMSSNDWFGLGLTIIDALDTMYIMDLQEEFEEGRNWIELYLNFDINRDINLFEVTIRVLGGLLSAYHLSGDMMFLTKSIDLGNRLLPCFNSPSGIPYSDVNLLTLNAHSPKWSPDSSTSEVTTIQLEFRDLSRASGDSVYEELSSKINEKVHSLDKKDGLVPIFINANTGTFRSFATISLGARGDSYYEYLLKQWLQKGKKDNDFLIEDYKTAINGVREHLVRETPNEHHIYVGELINGKDFKPKMDHLTCYLPGTLLLGYFNGMPDTHLTLAQGLLETCYQTYMKQPTLLAPEITYFNLHGEVETDIYVKTNDAHNLLRPEFVESLYYFYALTGNQTYQTMGWNIFQAFEKYTKVKHGYTSIGNVKNALNTRPRDMMESFFLGETLKYFYLLFSDDRKEIDLDKFVFNSEAHPLPIHSSVNN